MVLPPPSDRSGRPPGRTRLRDVPPVPALLAFLGSQRAGGAFLIVASILAMIWSNSSLSGLYQSTLHARLGPLPVAEWINDGLMAIFFLLVGLELRREIVSGELSSPARLAAPGIAALGGMVVPALIYLGFNYGNPAALRGWAVPVATDIAFALAVLALAGRNTPPALRVFLAALAVMDDLGAIVVIAVFYSGALNFYLLGAALVVAGALFVAGRLGTRALWAFVAGGLALWVLVLNSGIHATLAGVALAIVVPAEVADRLEHAVGRWVAFLVLPLFGLANAGLSFAELPPGVWQDPAALGVTLGLLVGKPVGVMGALMAAVWLGIARRPAGVTMPQLLGGAILCGIGFTMSLFVNDLAFRGGVRGDEIKLAIFAGSLLSAALGVAVLVFVAPRGPLLAAKTTV